MFGPELSHLASESLVLILVVSAPVLFVSLVVGLSVGLVQTVTQIQEQTLSFVPKLIAVGLTLVLTGGWMGSQLVRFTQTLWQTIPVSW